MRERDELTAFDKAFELAARLAEVMGAALAERGLTTARAEVLYVLHNQGPLVQRQLAQALRCTPRHVTTSSTPCKPPTSCTPHPTDRRATLVALTVIGQHLADELHQARRHTVLADAPTHLHHFIAIADRIINHHNRPTEPAQVILSAEFRPRLSVGTALTPRRRSRLVRLCRRITPAQTGA